MGRQHLIQRDPAGDVVAVADRIGALHAQVMSSVELALWARTEGLTQDAVQDALWRDRTLVKLWAMRKTLHVVPAARLGMWLAGLGTFRTGADWYGLRDPLMLELADLVGSALRGKVLTRSQLAEEVERLSGSAAKAEGIHGGWGGHLKPASFLGQICFAPSKGARVQFTHPDTWLSSPPQQVPPRLALSAIARCFLSACGPAVAADLATWWGSTQAEARQMIADLGDDATQVAVDGQPHWILTENLHELISTKPPSRQARLLPGFDPWVVCSSRLVRSKHGPGEPTALNPTNRSRIYRLQGWVSPVVLVNGHMAGVWTHRRHGQRLRIEIEPFAGFPKWAYSHIDNEIERLATFLGGRPELTLR